MKPFLWMLMFSFIVGCSPAKHQAPLQRIRQETESGNFTKASLLIDSLILKGSLSAQQKQALLFTKDSLHRVSLDFNQTREEVIGWVEKNRSFTPTDSLLCEWEKSGALEFRIIDGEKRYFRNAAPNLFRVIVSAGETALTTALPSDTPSDLLLTEAFRHKIKSNIKGKYLLPGIKTEAHYTLTVHPDAVPEGTTIKAWLPFPRKDIGRQTGVRLLSASQPCYILSGDQTAHTSIYMEQKARKGRSAVFSVAFEFTAQGEWFDVSEIEVKPYDTHSKLYQTYTAERKPHIHFSKKIRELTDRITQNAQTPIDHLQAIYRYIAANYPWASALEYSTIANIPEYVIEHHKGDCGQVALLLITMLRYKGIPARWQSGWMTHPGEVNLHDWAEVYLEGTGWVPVDISFGRGGAIPIKPGREFFMSGIDSYRLYVNSDFSGDFFPGKKFPRSETVDFQRGEVETDLRNLYFDEWSYHMKVKYIE
ncbi:MAG: transglutaminase-like domain-containing protein [Proteiniphilum sp.]|nr:transglutaminase-like domain-containing protein [Proteiniphilum sp.]